jgi:predicted AlkP superfamily pyrophosphatase or phosphodiesterase
MARRPVAVLALLLLGLFADAARADEPVVIVLSWDGTRWDYPDRAEFPALARMARDGVRAKRLVPVFPSNTFPNHVTLATGAHPDRHGIVGNVFVDTERGRYSYSNDASWIEAEPLWVAAERQGVRAASFFWVGSETDWHGVGASYRRVPFDGKLGESAKVDQILEWLALPEPKRPRLVMSWWHGADDAGHENGPDDPSVVEALRAQDAELGRLLAALDARGAWAYTTLLVVSDHGMVACSEEVDALGPLDALGIEARLIGGGGTAFLSLDDRSRRDEALAALAQVEGLRAFASDALPAELRTSYPRRTGDLVLVATPPGALLQLSMMESTLMPIWALLGNRRGMHGYLPEHPDMGAVFFAMGRGVPADLELGDVRALDVASTVARLLGIEPPRDNEGVPIAGIGER